MDIRRWDLYIDGRCLPRWFLTDAATQPGVRSYFRFDDSVEQYFGDEEEGVVFDPGAPAFAQLGGYVLGFRQVRSDGRLAMRNYTQGVLHWQVQGEGHEVTELGEHEKGHWWILEPGVQYVIYADYFGARTMMTVMARRCRLPLRDMSRALLNMI
jgi:hypothetical protein